MQFLDPPELVASNMAWATVLPLVVVLFMSPYTTDALHCVSGYSAGTVEDLYSIGCTNDDFGGSCYVVYDIQYDYWRYGCIESGHIPQCDNSLEGLLKQGLFTGIDSYYCCCTDENCNGKNFADECAARLMKLQKRADVKVHFRTTSIYRRTLGIM